MDRVVFETAASVYVRTETVTPKPRDHREMLSNDYSDTNARIDLRPASHLLQRGCRRRRGDGNLYGSDTGKSRAFLELLLWNSFQCRHHMFL